MSPFFEKDSFFQKQKASQKCNGQITDNTDKKNTDMYCSTLFWGNFPKTFKRIFIFFMDIAEANSISVAAYELLWLDNSLAHIFLTL
jgi:hypothetical protein